MTPRVRSALLKFATVCLATVVSVGLGLGLGELGLRLSGPGIMRLQHQHIILPQNRAYVFKNNILRGVDPKVVHHKNSLGFRGEEPPAELGRFLSVVAVGGSTTECFYLSDSQSWPEVAGAQLRGGFSRFWLNNAGLDGHSTFGHLILVRDYLLQLHPKVILFLVGVNDIAREDLVPSDREFIRENRDIRRWQKALRRLEDNSRIAAWLENLGRTWAAWRKGLLHPNIDLTKLSALDIPEAGVRRAVQQHRARYVPAYKQRLQTLIRLCKENGILPVLITQPALYGKGKDDVTGVDLGRLVISPGHNGHLDWSILQAYNDATRQLAREESVPLIELADQLPKTSRYFYDFFHFTRAGADAVGRLVAERLRPVLIQRFPAFVSKN